MKPYITIALTSILLTACSTSTLPTTNQNTTVPEQKQVELPQDTPVVTPPDSIDTRESEETQTKQQVGDNAQPEWKLHGLLSDVTGGTASGSANSGAKNGAFYMEASFTSLPALSPGYFYEGWLVQSNPFHFISTGEISYDLTKPSNIFSAKEDYGNYTQYVLTLEPDDGDPRPAKHILEGELQ